MDTIICLLRTYKKIFRAKKKSTLESRQKVLIINKYDAYLYINTIKNDELNQNKTELSFPAPHCSFHL